MSSTDPTVTPSGHPVGHAVAYTACALIGLHVALTNSDPLLVITSVVYAAQSATAVALLYRLNPGQQSCPPDAAGR